jgi:hypothetical protein
MNRRPPRPTLGMDGAGVLIIVGALLAGAAIIWAIVEGWPLLLLVGGLAIATKTAKRHREVLKDVPAAGWIRFGGHSPARSASMAPALSCSAATVADSRRGS